MAAEQGRILIVEDDASGVVIRFNLQRAGFQALLARNETEAWELLQRWELDLLIAEGQMPGVPALGFCRKVRQAARLAALPIVLLIDGGRDEEQEFRQFAPLEVLYRPFNPRSLVDYLAARLAMSRAAA
jgi:DNA-binding response OmpR family regulator